MLPRKLGLIYLAAFVLGLAGIALVAAAGNKPSSVPRDLEKLTFVHHKIPRHYSPPTWDDTEDDFRLIMGGAHWFETISCEVNPAGSGLVPEVVRSTLEESTNTWDEETGFALFAAPTITGESSIGYDDANRIVWSDLDAGVIAVAHLWINRKTKEIVQFDMEFNTDYPWSAAEVCPSDKMDLQNIATHEFGHNGLSDLRPRKDSALTMYAFSGLGETQKRSLGVGDILGIEELYGE